MNKNAKTLTGWSPTSAEVTGMSFVRVMSWWISCQKLLIYTWSKIYWNQWKDFHCP